MVYNLELGLEPTGKAVRMGWDHQPYTGNLSIIFIVFLALAVELMPSLSKLYNDLHNPQSLTGD